MSEHKTNFKPVFHIDKNYIDNYIRTLPCEVCAKWPPSQPHHIISRKQDYETVPICQECHDLIHHRPARFKLEPWQSKNEHNPLTGEKFDTEKYKRNYPGKLKE